LALSCFIALPLGFIAIAFVIKKSKKIFSSRQKDMANTNSKIEETFTGIQVVKLFNLENKQNKQFDVFNQNLKKTSRQSIFYGSVFMAIMSFVGNLGYAIVGLVCALLAFSSATVEQGVIE
jgi:ATP-binding cassette subfamily B protein